MPTRVVAGSGTTARHRIFKKSCGHPLAASRSNAAADEATTGDYTVQARLKGQTFRETFQVEEFRKVSFEVKVTSPVRHGMLGDKLAFQVAADFLFKAPVPNAKVTWDVQRRPHSLQFAEFPNYGFADYAARGQYFWYSGDESQGPSFVSRGEGKTDATASQLSRARPADQVRRAARLPARAGGHRRVGPRAWPSRSHDRSPVAVLHRAAHQEFVQAVDCRSRSTPWRCGRTAPGCRPGRS